MPIHDWTQVPSGLFHDFHQTWTIHIKMALNAGVLPKGLSALVEQRAGVKEPDVLAIESWARQRREQYKDGGGLLVLEPPKTTFVDRSSKQIYADRANRVSVKHYLGRTVAVIEVLSPGNKDTGASIQDFVDKTIDLLRAGIHVLLIDLFPPTSRDPQGIHQLIWNQIGENPFTLPAGKDRVLASYETGRENAAYVEVIGVGDQLPAMPLFVAEEMHVQVPLEPTYQTAWTACPEAMREAVLTGVLPRPEGA